PPNRGVREVDGIQVDQNDNPLAYFILHSHPGSTLGIFGRRAEDGQWIDAQNVIHWFRQDRGWLRGIPEITPSLPLCAMLRRYTLAGVQAAEIAADSSAVMTTEGPPNMTVFGDISQLTQEEIESQWFDQFPVSRGMVTTLPANAKIEQLKAEQPTAIYDKFVDSLLREILRPVLVPFN